MAPNACGPWNVAVLAGGDSHERAVSLKSGQCVLEALRERGHRVVWFDPADRPLSAIGWEPFDAAFLALHGGAGEDGRVQQWLQRRGVAYTGSGPAASHTAMCKSLCKERLLAAGVPTLPYVLLDGSAPLCDVLPKLRGLRWPLVLKPDSQGSSLGVAFAAVPEEVELALLAARRFDSFVLAEPRVLGREFTVAVLGRRALPLLEIVPQRAFYDYSAKYQAAGTEYRFDSGLPRSLVRRIERLAVQAAAALGTRGLVRVDLMLDDLASPWVLEVNTIPGLTPTSLAPKAAARCGMSFAALCEWMIHDCLKSRVPS